MKITKTKASEIDAEVMKRGRRGGAFLASMKSAPNTLNMHYLFCLKEVKTGWSMDDRKFYFAWVKNLLEKKGGSMMKQYLAKIRVTAIESIPEKDRLTIQYLIGDVKNIDLAKLPKAAGPGVAWTVESALKVLNKEPLKERDLANGKKMFSAGMCIVCHNFANEGGGVGPDLNTLAKRSDYRSMLESILQPNLVVSDQFEQHELKMKDGSTVLGRVVSEKDGVLSLVQSGFAPNTLTKVNKADVVSTKGSKISMMPPGLINSMNAEELKDLIAYLVSQGNPRHSVYRRPRQNK